MFLEKGEKTDLFVNRGEGCIINLDDTGFLLGYNCNNPTQKEIKGFESGQEFKIGFVRMNGVLFFLFKLGDTAWNDAPFHIKLSHASSVMEIEEGKGYALTAVLVDRISRTVKGLRFVGLGTEFSKNLRAEIMKDSESVFDKSDYGRRINAVYQRYSTKDLVKFCERKNMFSLQ